MTAVRGAASGSTANRVVTHRSRRFMGLAVTVEALTVLWSLQAVVSLRHGPVSWGVVVLLLVTALVFDEVAARAVRLRIRLSARLRTDMTSVWGVAATLALPRGQAVILLASVLGYDWFRHYRPAGEALHRKLYVMATCVAASLVASLIVAPTQHAMPATGWALHQSLAVASVIVVYTAMQRGLVTLAIVIMGARGVELLGSRDDNLIELATLCLGGLVSLAVVFQPWLVLLTLAPMITLHRGALVRELETAATTDSKTGLLNAVAWEQVAVRELARSRRENHDLSLLIIDIDHFKLVNDRYGHLVGDKVLRGISRSLLAAMREYDTVGRFGGEEFVAVLPGIDAEAGLAIGERVRARINELRVGDLAEGLGDGGDDYLAVSIGVASWADADSSEVEIGELLHAADRALYRAKAFGRNQVQLAGRGDELPEPAFER